MPNRRMSFFSNTLLSKVAKPLHMRLMALPLGGHSVQGSVGYDYAGMVQPDRVEDDTPDPSNVKE